MGKYIINNKLYGLPVPILIGLLLTVCIAIVYWQVGSHEFINFDDTLYVTDNLHVKEGISIEGIKWAFGFSDRAYWHPITWLSHMLDCELFGLNPGMHHLMNVFFHLLNFMVLFMALKMMTGALWRSAFVAALFALHPVNVDTVAWVAERKNLVSTLFWLLTMLSFAWYANSRSVVRYMATFSLFILGILSKPVLVTLPFVLLLLDYWPLRRITLNFMNPGHSDNEHGSLPANSRSTAIRLVLEKVPFIFMAFLAIYVSMISMRGHVDVISMDTVRMKLRVANALVSYVHYFQKMIWPLNLTIYYPFPESIPIIQTVLAGALIIIVTVFSIKKAGRYPYLIVGWLWYLGTLVPVSGIIQAGLWPGMAERWAYVPFIGLFIIVSWGSFDLFSKVLHRQVLFGVTSIAITIIFMFLAFRQAGYWENDFKLFARALELNDKNSIAYSNLADVFFNQGNIDEAVSYYNKAVELNPNDPTTQYNFAIALLGTGQLDKSIEYFQSASQRVPDDEQIYIGLGIALAKQGRINESIDEFSRALSINNANAQTHFQIAVLFGETGKIDEAIAHYEAALMIKPDYPDAGKNLRLLTDHKKRIEKAIAVLEDHLQRETENTDILNKIATLYSQKADYKNALYYLNKAVEIQPDNADGYYNIACIYARQDQVQLSIQWLEKAFEKGFSNLELLKTDKDLDKIRYTKYYKMLLKENEALGSGQKR